MALQKALSEIVERLRKISDTPDLDSQVLLAHVLDRPRSWLLAHPEADLSPAHQAALVEALSRLEGGKPLPYVLGHWEFFGLDFIVTPDVLIPRPETELLVEHALKWLQDHPGRRQAVDVGTGSGCIAVALAFHVPVVQLLATDISASAIDVAKQNAGWHGVADRIEFVCCDLFPQEGGASKQHPSSIVGPHSSVARSGHSSFDLLCANLPYIPTPTLKSLPIYGREPTLALDGGMDGLDLIRRLLVLLPEIIAPAGICLLEIEASQGLAALSLVKSAFPGSKVTLHQDLSGKDRLVGIEF